MTDLCFYCQRKMSPPLKEVEKQHGLSATIEHRRPQSLGAGEEGNVVLACRDCNELKGDLTEAAFEKAVLYMIANDLWPTKTRGGHYQPLAHNRLLRWSGALAT